PTRRAPYVAEGRVPGLTPPLRSAMTMEDGKRASRMVPWAVAAVAAAIVLDLAEDLIDPANTGTAAKVFEAASQQHGRMNASAFLLLATALCVVPGVAGLAALPAGRGRRLGWVAAALALLGGLGHAALAAMYLVWAAIPGTGATQAQLIEVVDRINSSS